MKWLLNLLTRGGYSRLESDNQCLRLAVLDRDRLQAERDAARNALAETGTERDGLLSQVDGLKGTVVGVEAHRDRVIESVTQFCKDIDAVECDRDLALRHAARMYAIANELQEALAGAEESEQVAQATLDMSLRLSRNLQASRDEYVRRLDAATVRAEAMRREVERQRTVIAGLREERDGAKPHGGSQRRRDRRSGRRRG